MKKVISYIAVAIMSLTAQLQAKPVHAIDRVEPTNQELYRQLCELNSGWLYRTPDFAIAPIEPSNDDEIALIQTHLNFVIAQLQRAETSHLTAVQKENRSQHIQTLTTYMREGQFPQNVFVSGYCPVFIDPWGTHCAVGHLIASSGHGVLAESINAEHQLDFLRDIKTAGLEEWQATSGLSSEELALIQPSYHSRTLSYPKEIEDLILGDSTAIREALEANITLATTRCGGKTLLHYAAAAGDLELVKFLIEKGADLHAVSETLQPIKAVSEAKTSEEQEKAKTHPLLHPRSSSTLYTVQWNEPTIMSPNQSSGLRMGISGRVFSTKRGARITNELNDIYGGVAGKNAIHFATTQERKFYNGSKLVVQEETNPELIKLNEERVEVLAWLKEQGLE